MSARRTAGVLARVGGQIPIGQKQPTVRCAASHKAGEDARGPKIFGVLLPVKRLFCRHDFEGQI